MHACTHTHEYAAIHSHIHIHTHEYAPTFTHTLLTHACKYVPTHTHTHKESGEMRAFMLLANVLLSNIHSSGGFKKKKKSIGKVLELC